MEKIMNLLTSFFSKYTDRGRAMRTALQSIVGIAALLQVFVTIPEVQHFLLANNLVSLVTIGAVAGVASFVQSKGEKLLQWLLSQGE